MMSFVCLISLIIEQLFVQSNLMPRKVCIVGVGMTKFLKPSQNNPDYPEMAKVATTRALMDAGIDYKQVQAAFVGYVYGDSTCGQRAVYEVGMTGIPIYNVNNNCATGSSALLLAKNLVEGGLYECALALGFEKMQRGSLTMKYPDRTNPLDKCVIKSMELMPVQGNPPFAPRLFGNAGLQHMKLFGTKPQHFGKIAAKNHKHSLNNPYSQFQKGYSLQQVMKSPKIYEILTKLQCCPTSDGAGAAIVCSQDFVKKWGLQDQAIQIVAMQMTTDIPKMFSNSRQLVGYSMSRMAADKIYQKTGVSPKQVGVVQLHDCFSANQLCTYEAIRLCDQGKAGEFIDKGDNTYGGRVVVNPSGGLTSKGHPLGATGLAQCSQLNWQLRGLAGKRQVPNLKYAMQHNLGLGGACVMALYKKYNDKKSKGTSDLKQIQAIQAKKNQQIMPKL